MNRSIILPLFALAMVLPACQIQSAPPTPASPSIARATETALPPPVPSATPVPPSPIGLTLDVLKNGTYHTPVYNQTFTLANGAYSTGSGTDTYSVQMLDTVAFGDLNDLFDSLFGGRRGRSQRATRQGEDVEFGVDLTLEEANSGVTKTLDLLLI